MFQCTSTSIPLTGIHPLIADPAESQIGAFYEAVGLDAILLMEYGGLNPMGREAKAGTKLPNVPELVRRLIWNENFPLEVVRVIAYQIGPHQ